MQIWINNSRCFGRTYALDLLMQPTWAFFMKLCLNVLTNLLKLMVVMFHVCMSIFGKSHRCVLDTISISFKCSSGVTLQPSLVWEYEWCELCREVFFGSGLCWHLQSRCIFWAPGWCFPFCLVGFWETDLLRKYFQFYWYKLLNITSCTLLWGSIQNGRLLCMFMLWDVFVTYLRSMCVYFCVCACVCLHKTMLYGACSAWPFVLKLLQADICMMETPSAEGCCLHDKWELSSRTKFRSKHRIHAINVTGADQVSPEIVYQMWALDFVCFFHISNYVVHFSMFAPSEVRLRDHVIRKRKEKHVCMFFGSGEAVTFQRQWSISAILPVSISVFSSYTACGMPRPQPSSDVCPPSVHFECCQFPFLRHGVTFKPPDMHVSIWK